MKRLFFIFLLFLIHYSLLIDNCFTQLPPVTHWQPLQSPVQANINSIISKSYLYAVGNDGLFIYSTNNGNTVKQVPGMKSINLNEIRQLNSYQTVNFIVGQGGTIYRFSNDNFSQLIKEPSGTNANLKGISDNKCGIYPPVLSFRRVAVGSGGTIIQSTWNLGSNWSSWTPVSSGTSQNLNSIDFYPVSYGLLNPVGCIAGNNGIILRTTDFGLNWSPVNANVSNNLNYVRFSDSLTCWITGSNGLIMKSTNRGLNWSILPSGTNADLKSISTARISINYFSSVNTLLVCGSGGLILQSSNEGMTWTNNQSPVQNNLNSISFFNSFENAKLFVAGDAGTILRRDGDSTYRNYRFLEGNNIKSFFGIWGAFDQDYRSGNLAGFEWPKGSGKTAIFTAGLSTAAYYNGELREAMASYKGEYNPGICNNGTPQTDFSFKLYSVKRGDNSSTNTDWLNWGLMTPYGAPFVDVNNNGIYDPQIDTPGVKNASQTIFICMTDGFSQTHNPGEGFGGGTLPLYAEVHLTAWCYSQPFYADLQFLKFEIINKSTQPWARTYFALISDVDLGNPNDDYTGCDTIRNLGYVYNGTNNDLVYGTAPPAAGFLILKGAYNKYSNPPEQIGIISSCFLHNPSWGGAPCESDPNGEPYGAYLLMKGYKKDSTCWLDPTFIPYKKTRVIFPGDPETNMGWTEVKGRILNCNHDTTGQFIVPDPPNDMKIGFGSGAENLTVLPGDTQNIVICQLIARGTSNLNSVTKLKQLADVAREFYNSGYVIGINKISSEVPTKYSLYQNYPNPFNPTTRIKFDIPEAVKRKTLDVKLIIYDILGKEIQTLVNEKLQPGSYEIEWNASQFSSGVYFYQLRNGDFVETRKLVLLK